VSLFVGRGGIICIVVGQDDEKAEAASAACAKPFTDDSGRTGLADALARSATHAGPPEL
jgi:hypothetical protein